MKKLLAVAAMAIMLCLTGLVMSGEAQAQEVRGQWERYGDGYGNQPDVDQERQPIRPIKLG